MTQDTSRITLTSKGFYTRYCTSQNTPQPGPSNSTPAKKRQRTRMFTQEASFEATLDMQWREQEKTMESLSLDVEIKEKLKKSKHEQEADLHRQVHQTWIDVGKNLVQVTEQLGK